MIKCNTVSNAYGCCCQFLSRIKPIIKNSIKSISSFPLDSIEYQYHAVLIDIYSQIKEGSDDIEIFSFINVCQCENKKTIDFITLLSSVLLYFDPCFKSDDQYSPNCIFYSSLLSKDPIEFQKSVIFDFEFTIKKSKPVDLIDSINEKYDYVSGSPKVLLFRPTNKRKFELSFYLPMKTHKDKKYFSLFAFIISKQGDESHYILYVSQSQNINACWICIDNDQISIISNKSLLNLSYSEDNNFIMFAFAENLNKSVEFLCSELKTIQKIDLANYEIGCQDTTSQSTQSSQNSLSSQYPQIEALISNQNSPSTDFSPNSQTSTSKKSQKSDESNNSILYDSLQPFVDNSNEICKYKIKFLNNKKMIFNDIHTSKEMKFSTAKRQINKIIAELGINTVFYSLYSEDHRTYHKHIKYDREINVYMQKQNESQILKYFVHSKTINIKFICKDIQIFKTTAIFDVKQKISELYDFCNTLLSNVLGIQVKDIELTLDNRKLYTNLGMCIEDVIWSVSQIIIYFSYKEK